MARILLNVLGILGVAILISAPAAMVAEPFWQKFFQSLGMNTSLWVEPFISFFRNSKIHLIGSGVLGMAIGAWTYKATLWFESRSTKSTIVLCRFLIPRVEAIIATLDRVINSPTGLDQSSIAPVTLVPEINSIYGVLEAKGFEVPDIPTDLRAIYIAQNVVYFRSILPYLKNYQLETAKKSAANCSQVAKERTNSALLQSNQ